MGKIEYLENPEQVVGLNRQKQGEPSETDLYKYYTVPTREFTFEYKNLGGKELPKKEREFKTELTQYEYDRLREKKANALKLPEFQFPTNLALFSENSSNTENLTNNQEEIANSSNEKEIFLHTIDKKTADTVDEKATEEVQENIQLINLTETLENVDGNVEVPKYGDFRLEREPLNDETLDLANGEVIPKGGDVITLALSSNANSDNNNDSVEENFISIKTIHAKHQKEKKEKLNKRPKESLTNFTLTKNNSNSQFDLANLLSHKQIGW